MTSDEIARLLETLRKRYTPDRPLPEGIQSLWVEQFRQTHRDDMRSAYDRYIADHPASESFPKPAGFRWYLQTAAKPVQQPVVASPVKPADRTGQQTVPCGCDNGWKLSRIVETAVASRPTMGDKKKLDGPPEAYEFTYPPGVYPCPTHRIAEYDRWHDQWVPEAIRMRPVRPTDTMDYNPVAKVAEVKAMLRNLGPVTKNAEEL